MRVKVELADGETLEDADEFLAKALQAKQEPSNERYSDPWLNELYDHINKLHSNMLVQLQRDVEDEINHHASG